MKYVVIDDRGTDLFVTECETENEALSEAERQWRYMTEREKRNCKEFAVLQSENPDEEASNHLDGRIVKFFK